MAAPVILAVDPDTRTLGWALVTKHEVLSVGMVRSSTGNVSDMLRYCSVGLPQAGDLLVVESQHYHHGSEAPPADIIKLAQVAGGIIGLMAGAAPDMKLCLVPASTWKGQTPKPINHRRTFQHYGIMCSEAAGYCYPSGCAKIAKVQGAQLLNKSSWEHVADAIGIGLYAAQRLVTDGQ